MRWLTALGGALLAVALFLPWYAYDSERTQREFFELMDNGLNQPIITATISDGPVASAWRVFSVVDLALAAIALVTLAAVLVPRLRLAAALAATAGVGLVLFRIVDHAGPDGSLGVSLYPSPAAGAWLALAGALVAAAAGWASPRGGS